MPGQTQFKIHDSENYPIEPIGGCEGMRVILRCIDNVAATGISILIRGEEGSGRKFLGRTIHRKSGFHDRPFVIVTEANIEEVLDRWEKRTRLIKGDALFIAEPEGHDDAPFSYGTLFIDEVSSLSLSSQRRLLRFVQENEPRGKDDLSDLLTYRIIASSARNLEQMVEDRLFREELFYRLNVVTLNLPPLRDRGGDLMQLSDYFLEKYAREYNRKIDSFSSNAMKLLLTYEWPGNVRELAETVRRALLATRSGVIEKKTLTLALQPSLPEAGGLFKLLVSEYEKRLITDALSRCRGKLNKAARLLRMSTRVIAYKVKKYAIDYVKYR
ncbi:MAG: sigma 54-interacting transcriptional regulator, partial [Chitinispirillaceae bacterium]